MTTEEFKKKVKELGYACEENEHTIQILKESVEWKSEECCLIENKRIEIAIVSKAVQGRTEIINARDDVALMTQIVLYIATPIEDREEKKRYKYRLKRFASESVISCMADTFLNYKGFGQIFCLDNDKEIGDAKTIFREDDPELELVHLEMFDAIEVDQEGNELHD